MRDRLTTAGELVGISLVIGGVFLLAGVGWALLTAGVLVFGLSFLVGNR